MKSTLIAILTFVGTALASIGLFWPEAVSRVQSVVIWMGWGVGAMIFGFYLLMESNHKREMKRVRQIAGDNARRARSLRSIVEEQKRELSDKEKALHKMIEIDSFILNRVDITDKAIPKDSE